MEFVVGTPLMYFILKASFDLFLQLLYTVELQYNGHPPSAAKMPVYWSLPLFMDPFSYFIIKMVSSKNDGILDFAAILGRR